MANPTPAPPPGPGGGIVPTFSLGDRLRKARELADLEVSALAEAIDIHRHSVTRYERDQAHPKRHVLLSWSMVTGVDLAWIVSGETDSTHVEQSTTTTDLAYRWDSEYPTRGIPRFRFVINSSKD